MKTLVGVLYKPRLFIQHVYLMMYAKKRFGMQPKLISPDTYTLALLLMTFCLLLRLYYTSITTHKITNIIYIKYYLK